jgi:septal ring factor EnvC (AmiA/AmiB activator)
MLKSRGESVLRLKRFQVEEKRRTLTQIEAMIAKAATQRRDNLAASERALKDQLANARAAYDEAVAELEKAEAIAVRDQASDAKHAQHSAASAHA